VFKRNKSPKQKLSKIFSDTDKVSVHGIWVKNTPNCLTPDDIYEIFKKYGEIQRIKVRPERKTKLEDFDSRLGSCEIYFTRKSDALEVVRKLNDEHIFREFYETPTSSKPVIITDLGVDRRGSSRFRIEASDDSSDNEMPEPEQVPLRPGELSKVIELTKAEQCLLHNTRFANFLKTQAKCKTGRQANLLRLTGEPRHIEKYIQILKDSAGGNYRVADEPAKIPDQIGVDDVMRMAKARKPKYNSSSAINSVLNYKIPEEIENEIKKEDFNHQTGPINTTEKINKRIEALRKRADKKPEEIIDLTKESFPLKRPRHSRFSDKVPSAKTRSTMIVFQMFSMMVALNKYRRTMKFFT